MSTVQQNFKGKTFKYRATPINIVCLALIALAIYTFIPPYHGYAGLVMLFSLPLIAGVFGIDLLIQQKAKKYIWVFIIESSILLFVSLLLFNSYVRYIAYYIYFSL